MVSRLTSDCIIRQPSKVLSLMESNTDRPIGFPSLQENKIKISGEKCYLISFQRKRNALLGLSCDDSGTREYCSKKIGLVPLEVKILKL